MTTPKVEPIKVQEFSVKQSKYEVCGKLPIRSVILGPSGSGKTVLLQNMILDIYRDCFSRIFVFSPSIEVDATWRPVKDYIEKQLRPLQSRGAGEHLRDTAQDHGFPQEEGRQKTLSDFNNHRRFCRRPELHETEQVAARSLHPRKAQHDLNDNRDAEIQRDPPYHSG